MDAIPSRIRNEAAVEVPWCSPDHCKMFSRLELEVEDSRIFQPIGARET